MPAHTDDTSDTENRTRRRWLAVLGAGVASGLAGCSSDSDGDGESDSEPTSDGQPNDTTTAAPGETPASGDGGPCPAGEFTYATRQYSAFSQRGYQGQCAVPESAQIRGASDAVTGNGFTVILQWGDELTSFGLGAEFYADPEQDGLEEPTVEGQVGFLLENSAPDLSRATDQFATRPDGAVVLVSADTVGEDPSVPRVTYVVFDHPEGVLSVSITLNDDPGCLAATERTHRRLVESQEPV